MTYTFNAKLHANEAKPTGRFKDPGADGTFDYWKWAESPAFILCIARVTEVLSNNEVKVNLLDPMTNKVADANVTIKLDDPGVWAGTPSTIGVPTEPKIDVTEGAENHVVICLTRQWLKGNGPALDKVFEDHPENMRKFPPGHDGYALQQAVAALASALAAKGGNPDAVPEYAAVKPPQLFPI